MKISDAFVAEFDMEMANTRKVLERVPDAKFSWKPHQKSWHMGGLAGHLANLPGWGTTTINTEELNLVPPFTQPPMNNSAEMLAVFDKNVSEARAAIAGREQRSSDGSVVTQSARQDRADDAARGGAAQYGVQPHRASSRPAHGVSAAERYPGAGDVRSVGGRAEHVWLKATLLASATIGSSFAARRAGK
jgi:hypothetical protein